MIRACAVAVALLALVVDQDRTPPSPAGTARGDQPERRLRANIAGRPYLKAGWVEVAVDGRTVELSGKVPDELHRRLAVLVCKNDPDVGRVEDKLSVEPALIPWSPTKEELDRLVARNAQNVLRADRRLA